MESVQKFKVNDIVTVREGHLSGIEFKVVKYDNDGRVEAEAGTGDFLTRLILFEDKFILVE
tara:strand:+ start:482 stop:664 length:183 start_codon:yes stop_codon:yes gene_type:complete